MNKTKLFFITTLLFSLSTLSCGLAQPLIDRVDALANADDEIVTPTRKRATPRPTFTSTPIPTDTPTATPTFTPTPTVTDTPVPTNTPEPTNTPAPTDTPEPTDTPIPPPTPKPRPPTATFTPAPPTATPLPNWAFKVREQGDRSWQKTNNSQITNIGLISDGNGTPLGGYYVYGEHSSGRTYKSAVSSWQYDVVNALGGYVKQGNVKVELGPYEDGTWYVWVVDGGGTQLSDRVPLSYSSNPESWTWDFIWWAQ